MRLRGMGPSAAFEHSNSRSTVPCFTRGATRKNCACGTSPPANSSERLSWSAAGRTTAIPIEEKKLQEDPRG